MLKGLPHEQVDNSIDTAPSPAGQVKRGDVPAKDTLEEQKLRLEIASLQRSPWLTPAIVIPLVATLGTVGLSWGLGVFDVERKRIEVDSQLLEIRKENLQQSVDKLETDKRALDAEVGGLRRDVERLTAERGELQTELDATKGQLKRTTEVLDRPILDVDLTVLEQEKVSLELRNSGKGLAQVREIRAFVSGAYVEKGPPGRSWAPALRAMRLAQPWVRWDWHLGALPGNSAAALLSIDPKDAAPDRAAMFRDAVKNLGLEICYCSALGKCDWYGWQRPPSKGTPCR